MSTFLAKIKIVAGKEAEFEETARMMFRETHANEPNVKRYEYWRAAEPSTYYCMESFPSFLDFMEHQISPHHEAPDFGSMIEAIEFEWIDPIQGACDLGPTDPVDLPADAPDLMKEYAASHPLERQDWWLQFRK